MRLWSISPRYLDRQGLLAVWREGLLAQKVLLQGGQKTCKYCNGDINYREPYPIQNMPCVICSGIGRVKTPYYNHPQLDRFKNTIFPLRFVNWYLYFIYEETKSRKYNFKENKIHLSNEEKLIGIKGLYNNSLTVTTGQLEYEFNHLQRKLYKRDKEKFWDNHNLHYSKINPFDLNKDIESHPLFKIVKGDTESWEKVK